MKRLWIFGFIGFLGISLCTEANAGESTACPALEFLEGLRLGRKLCQENANGAIGNKQICVSCLANLSQDALNKLCEKAYPDRCHNNCSSDFLVKCKKTCTDKEEKEKKTCEQNCEEYFKNKCRSSCTAIVPSTARGGC